MRKLCNKMYVKKATKVQVDDSEESNFDKSALLEHCINIYTRATHVLKLILYSFYAEGQLKNGNGLKIRFTKFQGIKTSEICSAWLS